MASIMAEPAKRMPDDRQIAEKKRLALAYLTEAWDGATAEGVDSEILAHAALFRAFADLIETYGTLHEAQLLPRSFGEGSLVRGQTKPAAVKQLLANMPTAVR